MATSTATKALTGLRTRHVRAPGPGPSSPTPRRSVLTQVPADVPAVRPRIVVAGATALAHAERTAGRRCAGSLRNSV